MLRVKKVKALESDSLSMLESLINDYIRSYRNEVVMDIKYDAIEKEIEPEFIEDDGKEREIRYIALLLIGEAN